MGQYKFRGKRIDNKDWVYGSLIVSVDRTWIKNMADKTTNPRRINADTADFRCVEVDPETVGQCIGLFDGKEVYKGDKVKITSIMDEVCEGEVVWDNDNALYAVDIGSELAEFWNIRQCDQLVEVIGNVYKGGSEGASVPAPEEG